MKRTAIFAAATVVVALSARAEACNSLEEAMAQFEEVKNEYVKVAPTMKPDQFTIWTTHLQAFGDRMGKMDYPGACAALETAAFELGFAGAAAPAAAEAVESTGKSAGKSGGKSGGKSTGDGASTSTSSASVPAPTPQPVPAQPAQPAPVPAQPVVAADAPWKECPRGRCRR